MHTSKTVGDIIQALDLHDSSSIISINGHQKDDFESRQGTSLESDVPVPVVKDFGSHYLLINVKKREQVNTSQGQEKSIFAVLMAVNKNYDHWPQTR